MAQVKIRFECGREDRVSQEYGPFDFVQLTYELLRVGPDGDFFAIYEGSWRFEDGASKHGPISEQDAAQGWSDVVIFAAE